MYEQDTTEKFWDRVDKLSDDECWLWTGTLSKYGYGLFWDGTTQIRAHRMAHELCIGSIPDGYVVAHRCDNPSCVNPAHLWACTQLENIKDRNLKGRQDHGPNAPQWTPREKKGPVRGERAPKAQLTEEQVREIRRLYKKGVRGRGYSALAKRFGVWDYTIEMIVKRKSWAHID